VKCSGCASFHRKPERDYDGERVAHRLWGLPSLNLLALSKATMSGRETIVPVRQKNWPKKLETAPTWHEIAVVTVKVCGLILILAGWCWLSGLMPTLVQFFMIVPVAVVMLLAVVYGLPLGVLASGLLMWAIARDVMRFYDRFGRPWRANLIIGRG
jgi:hypothetical protein